MSKDVLGKNLDEAKEIILKFIINIPNEIPSY